MVRTPSKFERAWRERTGRDSLTSPAVIDQPPAATVTVVESPDGTPLAQVETVSLAGEPAAPIDLGAVDLPALPSAEPLTLEFAGSSNVRAARLDAATGIVEVEFKGGKLYRYGGFTIELMATWREAPSAGSWFDSNVKKQPDRHPLIPSAKPER